MRFSDVGIATLFGGTGLERALETAVFSRATVVPVFMSDGYYVRQVIPERLDAWRTQQTSVPVETRLCEPVGTAATLAELIAARAYNALVADGSEAKSSTLVIVGHGSERNPASRLATERQATRIARRELFGDVVTCFLEEAPAVTETVRRAEGPVVVVGFFAAAGRHAAYDVVEHLAAADRSDLHYLGPIGEDPGMVEVIKDCVGNAAQPSLHGFADIAAANWHASVAQF